VAPKLFLRPAMVRIGICLDRCSPYVPHLGSCGVGS
jgi:hypothetical protein